MHFQTLLNIYKSIDSATFRFSFFPFNQVKGDFVLILALASNNLSVCVCCCFSEWLMGAQAPDGSYSKG